MSILHIALVIYGGLTLISIFVSFSACVVAGRSDAHRARVLKRSLQTSIKKNAILNAPGKKWALGIH